MREDLFHGTWPVERRKVSEESEIECRLQNSRSRRLNDSW